MSAAIVPPAPGLFSTPPDWPPTSCRRLEMSRAVMSVEPPGVNGTTTRTGLAGQPPTARATDGAASPAGGAAEPRPAGETAGPAGRRGVLQKNRRGSAWTLLPLRSPDCPRLIVREFG